MSCCRSALLIALAFIAAGVPQTLAGSVDATTLEGAKQTIALGPMASQEAIKQFGTNGGGFFNANSAHPFENPNAWSNVVQIWALLAVSFGLVITFGKMVGSEKQGWALFKIAGLVLRGRRRHCLCGGKLWQSAADSRSASTPPAAIWKARRPLRHSPCRRFLSRRRPAPSCGAVNAMHDSLTPLGGLIPMFLIQLGEITAGRRRLGPLRHRGLRDLTVFIAGLMVGRTPEFLGKKIESREVKLAMLAVLILPLSILGFSAVAAVLPSALSSLANNGPHGLSEILYAYTSVDRQQRLGLRRPQRQYALVQRHPRRRHGRWAASAMSCR